MGTALAGCGVTAWAELPCQTDWAVDCWLCELSLASAAACPGPASALSAVLGPGCRAAVLPARPAELLAA